jgi:dTDP-4-dehydrorhamnose reductase
MEMNAKKKILVTGSNGLLGQKLIKALIKISSVEVIATSKGPNRIKEKEGYTYESLDITDKQDIERVFRMHMPETVINTAAMTNVDACENDRELAKALNVTAVSDMIDVLKMLHQKLNLPGSLLPHFIHLSTDFIFDGKDGPYKEEDKPNPLSYYGETKWQAEKIVMSSSIKWCILRTVLVYGMVEDMSRSNVVLWAKSALEKGQKINVVNDQFRTPTLAEDLAQGCILAAMKDATGIFNISGKDFMSIEELVERVADFFELDKTLIQSVKSDTINQPAKRPPVTGFILHKAIKELGYAPHSFEEGLEILNQQLRMVVR